MIVTNILTKNPCYLNGRKLKKVKGLMLHSVGTPQPSASVFVKNWNKADYTRACVHGFIDANTGVVIQTLPWNYRGWHCGGDGNNTHIGVEMCESDQIIYSNGKISGFKDQKKALQDTKRTIDATIELFADLCKKYNLDPKKDICSHSEGHKKGIASNHGDPEHLWKALKMNYTMENFRYDVANAMKYKPVEEEDDMTADEVRKIIREEISKMESERAAMPPSDYAIIPIDEMKAAGLTDGSRPRSFATREEVITMMRASRDKK